LHQKILKGVALNLEYQSQKENDKIT